MFMSEQQSTDRFRAAHFSHLRHLAMFALVVESGSFTIAAQRLGIGKSGVSRHISELETYLGAQLLNRTTRSISLTDAGQLMFRDCARLVGAATDAFDKIDGDLPLAGTLRIATTIEHGQYVLPSIIASFVATHPGIDVDLVLGDAFVDLVENGIDLAIRAGSPGPSPQYSSRKIAELEYHIYGHVDDLTAHGTPQTPDAAAALPWLLNTSGPARADWTFEREGETSQITVPHKVTANSFNARIEIAKCGGHLIGIPDFIPRAALGPDLRQILQDYSVVPKYPIFAVYPNARFLSPKVVDFLKLVRASHP